MPTSVTTKALTRPLAPLVVAVWALLIVLGGEGYVQSSASVLATHPKVPAAVHWTLQNTYPAPLGALGKVACTSDTACVALGTIDRQPEAIPTSVVATTSDGGKSWTSVPLPIVVGLSGLSCPSSVMCVAVGGMYGGGGTLSGTSIIPNSLGTVLVSTDGGHTWTVQNLPRSVGYLNDVTCASVSYCMAVGDTPDDKGGIAVATTDQGATWRQVSLPANERGLMVVACPAPGTCLAAGDNILLRTTDGGQSWADTTPTGGLPYASSMACATVTTCVLAGIGLLDDATLTPVIATTGDGGVTWSVISLKPPTSVYSSSGLMSVSCGSAVSCMAVGGGGIGAGLVFTTTDGGSTWRGLVLPPGFGGLEGVSCVGPLECVVNGTDPTGSITLSAVTTNGGDSWSIGSAPVGVGGLQSVSCPVVRDCVAVGSAASATYAVHSTDGGSLWSAQAMATGIVGLSAVSCGSALDCVAVGFQTVPGQEIDVQEGAIVDTTDGGATWSLDSLPRGVGNLSSVSCATATHCVALGDAPGVNQAIALSTANGGATWSVPSDLAMASVVEGVSCPTTTYCVAVGQQYPGVGEPSVPVAEVTRDAGGVWVAHMLALPERGVEPTGISCASVRWCLAVGTLTLEVKGGPVVVPGALMTSTNGGTRWTLSTRVGARNLVAVACPTPAFCLVAGRNRVGDGPVVLSGNPGRGRLAVTSLPGALGRLLAVTCQSTRVCEVVGQSPFGGGLILKAVSRST